MSLEHMSCRCLLSVAVDNGVQSRRSDISVAVPVGQTRACMGSMVLQMGVCVLPEQMSLAASQQLV